MRLIKQSISKDGSGTITLFPEEPEDMWHAYNLLRPTDVLTAPALRKVTTTSSTGSTSQTRVQTTLTITITALDFDSAASELHVSGRVSAENAHVKLGSYHTLDLSLHRNFTLAKATGWDSVSLQVVKDACDTSAKATILAVVLHEGLAHVCALTEHQTLLLQKVEIIVPKKRSGGTSGAIGGHDKGLGKFFAAVERSIKAHFNPEQHRAVVLASPGFVAQGLKKQLEGSAEKGDRVLKEIVGMVVLAHSSSGHLHALHEALRDPGVKAQLSSTRYSVEADSISRFHEILRRDDGRAVYGPREVVSAIDQGAVGRGGGEVLVVDRLFRSVDVEERKKWVAVVDGVRDQGGEVRVFSSAHESGRRLEALGGVAALLTFPVEEMDSEDEDDGEDQTGVPLS